MIILRGGRIIILRQDTLGVSGSLMIEAIIVGEGDPERLADLARQRLREKIPALRLALAGKVRDHHRFLPKELRRGMKRAVMAVAHSIPIIGYAMLKTGRSYCELVRAWRQLLGADPIRTKSSAISLNDCKGSGLLSPWSNSLNNFRRRNM